MHAFPISALFALSLTAIHATPVTGWKIGQGAPPLLQATSANPIIGDGTDGSAKDCAIYASFPPFTLENAGDRITLSGTVELKGIANSNELRWAILDVNKQTGTDNWLGYVVDNSNATNPALARKRQSGAYMSKSGAIKLDQAVAENNPVFANGVYSFSLSYERLRNGSVDVTWELIKGTAYVLRGVANDKKPQTYTFNRAGFLFGNALHADQIKLRNVDLNTLMRKER